MKRNQCLLLLVFMATLAGSRPALANSPPTLSPIPNITINEDAGDQTVALSGIGPGVGDENQTLTLTAVSSNPSLIPNPTVTYVSPNVTGSLTFRPATNASGAAVISVIVNDGQPSNNVVVRSFLVTVVAVNDVPVISSIANRGISENTSTGPIPFTIADPETPPESLIVSALSSNPTLIPSANLVLAGSGANRTVTVVPATNQSGTATIILTATDSAGAAASRAFSVTVSNVVRISPIPNITINEDAGDQTVALYGIGPGAGEENQTLTVTAVSSNPSLIPNPIVTYTSPNPNGSLTFRPATNASGTATIILIINDGQPSNNVVEHAFLVTVVAVNDVPAISSIANRIINENTSTGPISFTIADPETPPASLIVSALSSNPTLIPSANLALAGSGANRTVTVVPAANQFGTATITLTATDGAGAAASRSFSVTANAELGIFRAGENATVSWTAANGVLQHCGEIGGLWEDVVPEATSPHSVPPAGTRLYRLRQR